MRTYWTQLLPFLLIPSLPPPTIPHPATPTNQPRYVLLAGVSTFFVAAWQSHFVGKYRKRAGIPYPYEYASYEQVQSAPPAKAQAMLLFNCAQRGHQNFNENHVTALGSMLISGLCYPRVAAALGLTWALNRVAYSLGYVSGKPGGKGRYYGVIGSKFWFLGFGLWIWANKGCSAGALCAHCCGGGCGLELGSVGWELGVDIRWKDGAGVGKAVGMGIGGEKGCAQFRKPGRRKEKEYGEIQPLKV